MSKFKMRFEQKTETQNPSMYLYGEIYKTFEDWWNGEEGNTAKGVQKFLEDNSAEPAIDIHINSMGGDVFEGTAMANQLRSFAGDVNIINDGFACSIASVIQSAGTHVSMHRNCMVMLHNIWTTMQGNASELRKMADDLDVMMAANKTIYLDKAGDKLSEDELTEMLDNETWLTAEQCLEYGLCDEIIDHNVNKDQAAQQAGISNVQQRTDDSIAFLQRSRAVLKELYTDEPVELEQLETPEEPQQKVEPEGKPENFLSLFS